MAKYRVPGCAGIGGSGRTRPARPDKAGVFDLTPEQVQAAVRCGFKPVPVSVPALAPEKDAPKGGDQVSKPKGGDEAPQTEAK